MEALMRRFSVFVIGLLLVTGGLLLAGAHGLATPNTVFAAPKGTLPPRPSITPSPTPTSTPHPAITPEVAGVSLLLRADTTRTDLWAQVQWQDGLGGWHDVEQWQGGLGVPDWSKWPIQWQIWGVYARDYGTGPFRWVVYAGPGSAVVTTSKSFYLPNAAIRLRIVDVGVIK
jgi:hypothetical protein